MAQAGINLGTWGKVCSRGGEFAYGQGSLPVCKVFGVMHGLLWPSHPGTVPEGMTRLDCRDEGLKLLGCALMWRPNVVFCCMLRKGKQAGQVVL